MNDTGIIWTEKTWNPFSGCKEITSGCAFCYAKTLAENKRGGPAFPNGFDLTLRPHKLREPFALKEPSLIFVNSMSDFFWEDVPDSMRDQMLEIMRATPQHQYQVLTKRPDVMLRYLATRSVSENVWLGVTIEDQPNAGRADLLRQVDASIRFVSAEPLLGPLELDWAGIHWCITGGESGVHMFQEKFRTLRGLVTYDKTVRKMQDRWAPRPDRMPWVRSIRDQCGAAGVKLLHKQWGGATSHSAGRLLDGRTWDEFPRLPSDRSTWR